MLLVIVCLLLILAYLIFRPQIKQKADELLALTGDQTQFIEAINDTTDFIDSTSLQQPFDTIAPATDNAIQDTTAQVQEPEERVYNDFLGTKVLNNGSRLAQIAREIYGSPYFWVYIYEANKDVIPDPNNIPKGTRIRIPNLPPELSDPDDEQCIAKAQALEKIILKN